jgi:hypothetical protein
VEHLPLSLVPAVAFRDFERKNTHMPADGADGVTALDSSRSTSSGYVLAGLANL